jgi:hypothetical protein
MPNWRKEINYLLIIRITRINKKSATPDSGQMRPEKIGRVY